MSLIEHINSLFNLERGRMNEEEEEEEEEEETGDVIFIVCCNGIELLSHKQRPSSRVGNNGIEVRFGHRLIFKKERRGKKSILNPSSIVDSSLSSFISSLLHRIHHPFSLPQFLITIVFKDGKNIDAPFPPTPSLSMYSKSSNRRILNSSREGIPYKGGICLSLLQRFRRILTRFERCESQLGNLIPP
jgi:hypothetical protein